MTADRPPGAPEPAPETASQRPRIKPGAVAIAVAALLVPLVLLLVLYRGGRKIAGPPAAPRTEAAAAAPEPDRIELPSISDRAASGVSPFGQAREPRDAAVDGNGRVWLADFGNSRLRIFDPEGGYLGGWGGRGDERFAFRDPSAVAIRGDDVYVADTWNGRIARFSLAGEWKGEARGLFGPRGLAVAGDGRVWVSDTGNHRIAVYPADLGPPQFFGKSGSGRGELSSPVGVAVEADGTVLVADTGNRRIARWSGSGEFVGAWAFPGWDRAVEPHLEVDADGSIWATDPGTAEALLRLDRSGNVLESRAQDDDGRRLSLPTGLALDRDRRVLYVVSSGSNTVSRVRLPALKKP